jgi:hypothetical protein
MPIAHEREGANIDAEVKGEPVRVASTREERALGKFENMMHAVSARASAANATYARTVRKEQYSHINEDIPLLSSAAT